jgi:hypothetical protein
MMQKYDIFKQITDNVFVWIDTVENLTEGKRRLTSFASSGPGNYHLWDISRHKFIDRLYLEDQAERNTCLLMDKGKLIQTAKIELMKHSWDTFVDEPPSVAEGGKGVVVAGCPRCRMLLNTTDQYLRHLADDVLPKLLDRALADATGLSGHS